MGIDGLPCNFSSSSPGSFPTLLSRSMPVRCSQVQRALPLRCVLGSGCGEDSPALKTIAPSMGVHRSEEVVRRIVFSAVVSWQLCALVELLPFRQGHQNSILLKPIALRPLPFKIHGDDYGDLVQIARICVQAGGRLR